MSKLNKILSVITAASTLGMYAFSMPVSAASDTYSPIMTGAEGVDGNMYNPSVKLAYMPVSGTAVNADYLSENSKTIRSAANMIYEWSGATEGPAVKTVDKSELKSIGESRAELLVYGTTQVKYTTAEDYELAAFYIQGADYSFANGEANTRTNPYVEADGTTRRPAVTEFVNKIKLSEDLLEEADKVYVAAYGEDGVLKNAAVYDAAAEISLTLDENGEGFAVAPNDILKVFVWGNNQKPIYVK